MPSFRVPAPWRTLPIAAAVLLTALGVAEVTLDPSYRAAPLAPVVSVAMTSAGAVLAAWSPLGGALLMSATFPAVVALGVPGPPGTTVVALLLAYGWLGYRQTGRHRWVGPLAGHLMAVVAVVAGGQSAWESMFFGTLYWVSWWVGRVVRRERTRGDELARLAAALDAEREARDRAVVMAERQRIAREIHDAVAHSVSVMVLQIGVLRTRMDDRPMESEVLLGVERLGRQSVQELRGLVGILRDEAEAAGRAPQPSLRHIDELIDDVRAAGLPVELELTGDFDLPRTLDVSAYRIAQEALSNVLRHAGPVPTRVRVCQEADTLTVEVTNDPSTRAPAEPAENRVGGHGLIGMRERVVLFGGTLRAGPGPTGGYAVCANFPIRRTR
ncbi:histidine kinase [Actinoplanes sp. NBC_00393]|uniref:sensor histidine kinase n=1 Tax=Actinoplanes sp. NBC_00393 TaxID=2975953 RepID=UPI002E235E18